MKPETHISGQHTIRQIVSNILDRGEHLLLRRSIPVLIILFCIGVVTLLVHVSRLQSRIVEITALQNAVLYSQALKEFRTLYTSEVVERANTYGIEVTHDYHTKEGAIPLPATLSILLGNRIAEMDVGGMTRLYSDYPFPWREAESSLKDDFEREALQHLRQFPDQPFFRFEDFQGRLSLRFATADLMRQNCIGCHNSHPDSPKIDWQVGDVRGVLEVVLPLDQVVMQTRDGIQETFVLGVVMSVVGLLALGLVIKSFRQNSAILKQQVLRINRSRDALRLSDEILIQMPDAILITDFTGKIQRWLGKAQDIFGYTAEEAIGKPVSFLHHPDIKKSMTTKIVQKVQETDYFFGEILCLRKDGSEVPIETTARALYDADGNFLVRIGINRDITERKKAREALRQAYDELEQRVEERTAELAQANMMLKQEIVERRQIEEALAQARDQALEASHLKSELLAKVSHELRTPLGAILGYSQMLSKEFFGPLSDEQTEKISEIIDSTNYLTTLINELLDQSQIEAGKLSLNYERFSPQHLLEQVRSKMQILALDKGLTLTTNMAADVPATLSSDPIRLQQILVNLVGNAIKFTQQGEVQVHIYTNNAMYWSIQVTDTGPGIPEKFQTHIFDPFGQVDGSITRTHDGTGLGLAIVKQITTLMGGRVSLDSQVGQGSTFTILLPLNPIQEKTG